MKIAVTYENGTVYQHFGHTAQFKVYDVENGKVLASRVIDTNGSGHGALAGLLQALGAEVLICGGIGGGAQMALAEAGIALYGALQDKHLPDPGLLPVMTLKTRIVQLHELCQGDSVSYGRCYTADHAAKAAVLPIGYADGLHRSLSGKAKFLLHGIPVSQIGRICMDMCMLCTDPVEDAAVGDEIVIFGKNAPVSSLAEAAGTISYELLCSVSRRVPRIWL